MTIRRCLAATAIAVAAPSVLAQGVDPDLARNLAATCANCHGTNGRVRGKDLKPLAGVPADKILAKIADFKSGAQPATLMNQLAKGFTDEQMRLIAEWYAAQSPAR